MTSERSLADRFLDLHVPGSPLVMPNVWDLGSARIIESLGFAAAATTSSGFAATLGRRDGQVTRNEAINHGSRVAAAVDIPVSADLEDGYGPTPEDAAETVRRAAGQGLAGCSIEDATRDPDRPVHELGLAVERVAAAAEAAHGDARIVLTARAENLLYGAGDLDDTIARLQAYAAAGADVLFAPGLGTADAVRAVVESVDRPVNVLVHPGLPPIPDLAELGIARVSVGGSLAFAALAALVDAATELRDAGTYGWTDHRKGLPRHHHQRPRPTLTSASPPD